MTRPLIKLDPWTRVNDHFNRGELNSIEPNEIRHRIVNSEPNSYQSRYQADFYRYIACDISVETVLNYPYPYVTEKSLRAFASKRILIVLGPVGVLKLLKSRGFKTFDDFIDESYDTIDDPVQRIRVVSNEVHKLCAKPLEEIVNYMTQIQSRLEHNFVTLYNLKNFEIKKIQDQLNYDSN